MGEGPWRGSGFSEKGNSRPWKLWQDGAFHLCIPRTVLVYVFEWIQK